MKIRSYLVLSFLAATLLPTLVFGVWSYQTALTREMGDVKDKHFLLARNIGFALERYQRDLVAALDAVSATLAAGNEAPEMYRLLDQLDMRCVLIVDKQTGQISHRLDIPGTHQQLNLSQDQLAAIRGLSKPRETVFSDVFADLDGTNVILLVKDLGGSFAIGKVATDYLIDYSRKIVFGAKGHSAIVDRSGNVIAHPNPDWVRNRKNIAQVSAVRRMMNGESGIEEFFSPAVNADMIAGFASVPGPGWGVMVPQPISEIRNKVAHNQFALTLTLLIALALAMSLGLLLARSLSRPLEQLAAAMRTVTEERKLTPIAAPGGVIPFQEIVEIGKLYNKMVSGMTKASEKIQKLAYNDHVTGLPNRDRLNMLSGPILDEAILPERGGILLLVDLDNFKEINDLHGHHAGDLHLRACASTLLKAAGALQCTGANDASKPFAAPIVARIGGDEFIVIAQGLTGEPQIQSFLDGLLSALATPSPDLNVSTSASIGCARFPNDGLQLEELIKCADIAMYHAKGAGKNRTQLYTPMIGRKSSAEIRRDVLRAIENNELFLEYQPKICTRRRVPISVEALVRWNHPDLGLFLPGFWVPVLNGSHTMVRLGEWVIATAMKDLTDLIADGHDLWVSVNIGSEHFIAPDFAERLETLFRAQGYDRRQLEIEVTEDALFESEKQAAVTFNQLSKLGFRVSIDDFGSGYSNLARLSQLPVDFLKLDRSIIVGASGDARVRTILSSTFSMARSLGCKTVAEGVETEEQAEFATDLGADCLQGYYFTPALPMARLREWLALQRGSAGHPYLRPEQEAV